MTEEPKIIQAKDVDGIEPDLPPAGYDRDEEYKRRIDDLERQIELMQVDKEVYRLDPSVLREDREILSKINELEVSEKQEGFFYMWAYFGHNGFVVNKLKYLGWRVVLSNDPECPSLKEVDGTRRIGDTLLMRIPQDKYFEIEDRRERLRVAQQEGIESALRTLGDKYRDRGIKVHTDIEGVSHGKETLMDRMEKKAANEQRMRQLGVRHKRR